MRFRRLVTIMFTLAVVAALGAAIANAASSTSSAKTHSGPRAANAPSTHGGRMPLRHAGRKPALRHGGMANGCSGMGGSAPKGAPPTGSGSSFAPPGPGAPPAAGPPPSA
jgi:hypothetical protein